MRAIEAHKDWRHGCLIHTNALQVSWLDARVSVISRFTPADRAAHLLVNCFLQSTTSALSAPVHPGKTGQPCQSTYQHQCYQRYNQASPPGKSRLGGLLGRPCTEHQQHWVGMSTVCVACGICAAPAGTASICHTSFLHCSLYVMGASRSLSNLAVTSHGCPTMVYSAQV